MKSVLIIDTFGFFFRSYYALPPLHSPDGFPTGLLSGFINFIQRLQKERQNDYIVFALDSKGDSFRNEIYSDYKANRQEAPEDLKRQLPIAIEWIKKMGFATLEQSGFEADDLIATLATVAKNNDIYVRIASHDKDLYQLIDDGKVELYDTAKGVVINRQYCLDKFGVEPCYFTNFQALLGDSSDNVPGVKGIGKVGAAKLIGQFNTLEGIYENIENAGTKRIINLLNEGKEQAFLSRDLVTMRCDIFDHYDFENALFEEKNYLLALQEELERYAIGKGLRPLGNSSSAPMPQQERFDTVILDNIETFTKLIEGIDSKQVIAFDIETTSLDTSEAKLVGFSFCFDTDKSYYVPVAHSYLGVGDQLTIDEALEAIMRLFDHPIVGHNLKYDLGVLSAGYNLEIAAIKADTMVMAWLDNPGSKVGMDALAKKIFKYEMKPFSEMVKKGEDFSSVEIEKAAFYAAEDAWMTWRLYQHFQNTLSSELKEVAQEVEYPFVQLLCRMQPRGITLDIEHFKRLTKELESTLEQLTQEIYELCGGEFNIRSTQQLGHMLFEVLGLPGAKKTKTGYSTNEATLSALIQSHEVIAKILSYREIQKMLSTYLRPLLLLAQKNPQGRISTQFVQTGTATGRLSSKEPNLQNIPVRSELGKKVREGFVAKEGYCLVSIDYSQIELRLLAHFSKDPTLLEAFSSGDDIHLATAKKLFGEEEANNKRSFAKSINFGLLYGMGPKKLSEELGISQTEAKGIIQSYFEQFPTIKSFLSSIQEGAKEHGYVKTLLGRRRLFDFQSANGMQKAAFLRESVNTLFQGSAADLIKLSMLRLDEYIATNNLDAQMLLQIHDELIFEVEQSQSQALSKQFASIMESIYLLDVALECSVSIGKSWGELK